MIWTDEKLECQIQLCSHYCDRTPNRLKVPNMSLWELHPRKYVVQLSQGGKPHKLRYKEVRHVDLSLCMFRNSKNQ